MRLFILVILAFLCVGCAHRSRIGTQASPGFKVTFPETSGDYPSFRASVRYKSREECAQFLRDFAAERHLSKVPKESPGGEVMVLVDIGELKYWDVTEVIILRNGSVEKRGGFKLGDVSVKSQYPGTRWHAWTVLELDAPPSVGAPVAVEIVGPGLDDGPYRFKVEASP